MRLVLLGDADDARGFRLAGVETTICRTRADVDHAVAQLFEDGGEPTSVVLVSAPVHHLAPSVIDALQDRPRWPILVLLPEHGNAARHET